MDIIDCYAVHAPLYRDGDLAYVAPTQAMKSAAGWYAGSWCIEAIELNGSVELIPVPYDRISDYFATEAEARSYANWVSQFD